MKAETPLITPANENKTSTTALAILFTISCGHLLNDTIQSLLPALYPLLKISLHLNFAQVGLITLAFQLTASLLQPLVGIYTDHHPQPFSLAAAMIITLVGVVLFSIAGTFEFVLLAAALIGIGSSIFHPEASRVARMASGGRHGFAQSLFQVGGNTGSALGPLLAAVIIAHGGQSRIAWFAALPLLGVGLLSRVGRWYRNHLAHLRANPAGHSTGTPPAFSRGRVIMAISILAALIFSKYFYLASISSYYTFYLIDKFHVSVRDAQLHLFLFLAAVAAGTIIGGPVGDRFGRKYVIWVSILGVAPFTLLLPYANLFWCATLTVVIGLVLASAFSAILVYAQELIPNRIGLVSGIFFGFAFGMGGIGSAVLGSLADHTSINYVFHVCSFLPLIGLLTAFLPSMEKKRRA
ncbi:MAG TPA: MFS transporter [Opitutaceae bacterium]|jgi:FSR family fosmidomycin resistance protein-like MFS transporter|nr:MFS transporter [Opitutaceae bacterium]